MFKLENVLNLFTTFLFRKYTSHIFMLTVSIKIKNYFKTRLYFDQSGGMLLTKTRDKDVEKETNPCKGNRKYRDGTPYHRSVLHQ
jgi:hypothetical protein